MPISSRFAPVMLASASEHGDSPMPSGGRHAAPYAATACPALNANTRSTAYSGQHRDEREERDGQTGRDVELGHLGGPGQDERRADDGEPEGQRRDGMRHLDVTQPQHQRRDRRQDGEREREALAAGLHVLQVPGRTHPCWPGYQRRET